MAENLADVVDLRRFAVGDNLPCTLVGGDAVGVARMHQGDAGEVVHIGRYDQDAPLGLKRLVHEAADVGCLSRSALPKDNQSEHFALIAAGCRRTAHWWLRDWAGRLVFHRLWVFDRFVFPVGSFVWSSFAPQGCLVWLPVRPCGGR